MVDTDRIAFFCGKLLDVRPGATTEQVVNALINGSVYPHGSDVMSALHQAGRQHGFGQDINGRWWSTHQDPDLAQRYADGRPSAGQEAGCGTDRCRCRT